MRSNAQLSWPRTHSPAGAFVNIVFKKNNSMVYYRAHKSIFLGILGFEFEVELPLELYIIGNFVTLSLHNDSAFFAIIM